MNDQEMTEEPGDDLTDGLKRRDFLKVMAGSFAALASGGCKIQPPKDKIIPSLIAAEDGVPGKAVWYSTTCSACPAQCGALAKVRDGRPIKLEGNPSHPATLGGLCARGHASLLDLYDSNRHAGPRLSGAPASWDDVDLAAIRALERARVEGKAVRLLTGPGAGPTFRRLSARLEKRFPGLRSVSYAESSLQASGRAHRLTHGRFAWPTYRLEKCRVIVSIDADFLGTWGSPVEQTRAWASRRKPDDKIDLMSWHAQFEARMSPTGANADLRVPIKPSERYDVLAALGRLVAQNSGWTGPLPLARETTVDRAVLLKTADALFKERKRALVLCGSDDVGCQVLANWINHMIGAYEQAADLSRPSGMLEGGAGGLEELIEELSAGKVAVLIVRGCNPAVDHPLSMRFREAAKRAGLIISLAGRPDETAALAHILCPEHHPLESWADHDVHSGVLSLSQPMIAPLRGTRDALETLERWDGGTLSARELVRERWRTEVFPRQDKIRSFNEFWEKSVREGVLTLEPAPAPARFTAEPLLGLRPPAPSAGGFELVAYESAALGAGAQANNPWLQELPDPVTKITWGNAASFAPEDARRLGLAEGRVVALSAGSASVELAAHIQPGQAPGTVAAALGYGRSGLGPMAGNFPTKKVFGIDFEPAGGGDLSAVRGFALVSVSATSRFERLAKTQSYDYLVDPLMGERRDIVRETTLADYALNHRSGNPEEKALPSLWAEHEYQGHRWGMAIDLNACTGCSSCVLSCNMENNVPVVGRAEVAKSRDMHWLRLDRYYSGSPQSAPASPEVSFQPMLCQHCGNAPCETVCPVLATAHSTEGLNMQVYNRCVGTRYCANNCPYKVRRFNWFDYAHEDLTSNLALNPDVTVRTRGIMEKCSFCVQRIYTAKGDAKIEGRVLRDGDIAPACAQSCPAQAIVFGDLNDPKSRVSKLAADARAYRALAELGVRPSVHYLTKVRNKRV